MKHYRFTAQLSPDACYEGVARAKRARQVQQLLKERGLVSRKIAWFEPDEPVLADLPGEPDHPGEAQILLLRQRGPLEPDVWPIWKRVPVIGCGLILVFCFCSFWLIGAVYGPYQLVTSWQTGKASLTLGGVKGMRGSAYRDLRNPETGEVVKRERKFVTASAKNQPIRYWFLMSMWSFGVIGWYAAPLWFIWKVFFAPDATENRPKLPNSRLTRSR